MFAAPQLLCLLHSQEESCRKISAQLILQPSPCGSQQNLFCFKRTALGKTWNNFLFEVTAIKLRNSGCWCWNPERHIVTVVNVVSLTVIDPFKTLVWHWLWHTLERTITLMLPLQSNLVGPSRRYFLHRKCGLKCSIENKNENENDFLEQSPADFTFSKLLAAQ